MTEKEIIDTEEFSFENKTYIARLYHPTNNLNSVYGEIVDAETKQCPNRKMREIAREILKQHGITVPTSANKLVTHSAIKELIKVLRKEKN